jgi:hypothetical protein
MDPFRTAKDESRDQAINAARRRITERARSVARNLDRPLDTTRIEREVQRFITEWDREHPTPSRPHPKFDSGML